MYTHTAAVGGDLRAGRAIDDNWISEKQFHFYYGRAVLSANVLNPLRALTKVSRPATA